MLEELLARGHKGAEYDAWLIKIGDGDQFGSGFVAINPNSKIPALLDRSGPKPIRVFETGAILMHLAEKFGEFLPTEAGARAECLSWLFWQMGSTPYVGGGFGHFYAYAPIKIEYAIDRFTMETKRLLDVLDRRLARASMSPAPTTRSPTSRSSRGMAGWRSSTNMGRPSSSRCTSTRTSIAGPTCCSNGRRSGAGAWSTVSPASPRAAARAPRRQRLRDEDPGQARRRELRKV